MQIEQITEQEKVNILDSLTIDDFEDIEEEIAKASFQWDQSHRIEVYWDAEKKALSWFVIEQNSIQPLDLGDCYVVSLPCGADASAELDGIEREDETGERYIPATNWHPRIPENQFVDFLFGEYCDASHIIEHQREEIERRLKNALEGAIMAKAHEEESHRHAQEERRLYKEGKL